MKAHPLIGYRALKQSEECYGECTSSFLRYARQICCSHHERWDGSGYPYGLRGEEIPLSARIMAIADVYDALVNKRVYKDAYDHLEAVDIIKQESGRAFDPYLVELFLEYHLDFRAIAAASLQNQTMVEQVGLEPVLA